MQTLVRFCAFACFAGWLTASTAFAQITSG